MLFYDCVVLSFEKVDTGTAFSMGIVFSFDLLAVLDTKFPVFSSLL